MASRRALDAKFGVQIPAPQLKRFPEKGGLFDLMRLHGVFDKENYK